MAVDFAAEEAATLKRWREIDAFQTQLRLSKGNKPYTFYDGKLSLKHVSVCPGIYVTCLEAQSRARILLQGRAPSERYSHGCPDTSSDAFKQVLLSQLDFLTTAIYLRPPSKTSFPDTGP